MTNERSTRMPIIPRKPKYRVLLNPTGENYGVTCATRLFTEYDAFETFRSFSKMLQEQGSPGGYVMMDDEPQCGAQSSDILLRQHRGAPLAGFATWMTALDEHVRAHELLGDDRQPKTAPLVFEPEPEPEPDVDPTAHTLTVNDNGTITVEFDGWYTIEGVSHYMTPGDFETQKTRIVFHKENL